MRSKPIVRRHLTENVKAKLAEIETLPWPKLLNSAVRGTRALATRSTRATCEANKVKKSGPKFKYLCEATQKTTSIYIYIISICSRTVLKDLKKNEKDNEGAAAEKKKKKTKPPAESEPASKKRKDSDEKKKDKKSSKKSKK